MAEENRSGWDRALDELKSPWDWTAAIAGGAGGALVTIFLHGGDLGHSIPTGALGAVTARRAAVAGLQGWTLGKKAQHLLELLAKRGYTDMETLLSLEVEKWQAMKDNERFAKVIDEISERESKRTREAWLRE